MTTDCYSESFPAEPCPPANGWPWGLPVGGEPLSAAIAVSGALAHGPAPGPAAYNWVDQEFEEPFFG